VHGPIFTLLHASEKACVVPDLLRVSVVQVDKEGQRPRPQRTANSQHILLPMHLRQ